MLVIFAEIPPLICNHLLNWASVYAAMQLTDNCLNVVSLGITNGVTQPFYLGK